MVRILESPGLDACLITETRLDRLTLETRRGDLPPQVEGMFADISRLFAEPPPDLWTKKAVRRARYWIFRLAIEGLPVADAQSQTTKEN